MSAAYFIVLDNENPGFDTLVNGKFLARDAEGLARVAESLGLPQLDAYVSYSPDEARALIEDMGGDPEGVELPGVQWFDADEGLTWVAKVVAYLTANPTAVKNVKGVLSDLREYEELFAKAKAVGARWRLQVDF